MSILKRIDLFASSLPRICLYCVHGVPIVWGIERFLDVQGCVVHSAWGLRSKKLTAPKPDRPGHENVRGYMPLMYCEETCEHFKPCSPNGDAISRRKFRLLDAYGYFDEREEAWRHGGEGA